MQIENPQIQMPICFFDTDSDSTNSVHQISGTGIRMMGTLAFIYGSHRIPDSTSELQIFPNPDPEISFESHTPFVLIWSRNRTHTCPGDHHRP